VTAAPIAVAVVDDHALAREGLETLLTHTRGMKVAGSASCGADLKALMIESPPDVVLMDIKLQAENGLELTRWLKSEHPDVHVIILSNYDEGPLVIEAISVGASGYLLKDCSSALLLHTIHAVTDGAVLFKKELLLSALSVLDSGASIPERDGMATLTREEVRVLKIMATGARNRAIGAQMHLSEATVKNRVSSILAKLKVSNRTEAVAVAARVGFAKT